MLFLSMIRYFVSLRAFCSDVALAVAIRTNGVLIGSLNNKCNILLLMPNNAEPVGAARIMVVALGNRTYAKLDSLVREYFFLKRICYFRKKLT